MWTWLKNHFDQIFTVIQTVIMAMGVYALVLTQQQIQGSTIQAAFQTTADLTLKALEDPDFHSLVFDRENTPSELGKQRMFLALLINHYYTMFRQYRLGTLPSEYWEDVRIDAKAFFNQFIPKDRWGSMKQAYAQDFRDFVDSLYAN